MSAFSPYSFTFISMITFPFHLHFHFFVPLSQDNFHLRMSAFSPYSFTFISMLTFPFHLHFHFFVPLSQDNFRLRMNFSMQEWLSSTIESFREKPRTWVRWSTSEKYESGLNKNQKKCEWFLRVASTQWLWWDNFPSAMMRYVAIGKMSEDIGRMTRSWWGF